jgi:hypothetical protein
MSATGRAPCGLPRIGLGTAVQGPRPDPVRAAVLRAIQLGYVQGLVRRRAPGQGAPGPPPDAQVRWPLFLHLPYLWISLLRLLHLRSTYLVG